MQKFLNTDSITFFKRLNKTNNISRGILILEDMILLKAKSEVKSVIEHVLLTSLEKLEKELHNVHRKAKLFNSPNPYAFFGVPMFIYFIGFYLIASFEAVKQRFSSKRQF